MRIKSSDDLAINGKAGTVKPALVERGNEIFIIWYDGDFDLRLKYIRGSFRMPNRICTNAI